MALTQHLRLGRWLAATLLACGFAGTACGTTRIEVYQSTVPLAGRSDAAQAAAFQAALKMVLARATGRRNVDDAVFAPLLGNARRYVQQFRNAADNRLWVAFDGAALERWLIQNGQPVWGRDRPTTFVWLTTQGNGGIVGADDQSDLKQELDAAAAARGIPLAWPGADAAAAAGSSESGAAIAELARKAGAEATLIGHAAGNGTGAAVHWTLAFPDHGGDFNGAVEGINRTADQFAALYAATGALAPVDIEVAGLAGLRDYAATETYLESLSLVTHVAVDELRGGAVRFRLTMRGGMDALQRALALGGRLQALPAGEDGVQRFQLRH